MRESTRPIEAEGLGPAATAIILLLGVALSAAVWQGLRSQQEARTDQMTERFASALAQTVEARLDALYGGLRRRAELWAASGDESELGAQSVKIFLAENPAVLAVMRGDPSGRIEGSEEGREILRELSAIAAGTTDAPEGDRVIGPVTIRGRPMLGFEAHVSELDRDLGSVFAAIDLELALRDALANRAPGFVIEITAGGTVLHRRDLVEPGESLAGFARSEPITPKRGEPWTLTLSPTTLILPRSRVEESPVVALAFGLLVSFLVAAAVHYGTLAWRRAEALRLANAALARQIDESRRGEGEFKKLSEALEARVAERTSELEETIVELETFNYSASHDLRGPLGAIINFAAILAEDYGSQLDAAGREHLERIIRSADATVSMMDALLAYSRSGRAELRKVPLDVRRLVQEVCDDLKGNHPQLAGAVRVGELPEICADEAMMRSIFTNLISNACKFANPEAALLVEVGGHAGNGGVVYFVRDDGVGFDMRFADKLFRVFERLHVAERYPGQGVGLAIVARMVRRHGGRIWAQGAVGKGATFYFELPATEESRDGGPSS